jgi:hypothetical protein
MASEKLGDDREHFSSAEAWCWLYSGSDAATRQDFKSHAFLNTVTDRFVESFIMHALLRTVIQRALHNPLWFVCTHPQTHRFILSDHFSKQFPLRSFNNCSKIQRNPSLIQGVLSFSQQLLAFASSLSSGAVVLCIGSCRPSIWGLPRRHHQI